MSDEEEVIECNSRLATPEECYYLQWLSQAPERHLRLLTDLLGRTIALATALAGGAAVFVDDRITHPAVRLAAIAFFLVALAAAAAAIYPREEQVAFRPSAVKAFMEAATSRKRGGLAVAAACLFMGVLVLSLSLLIRLLQS